MTSNEPVNTFVAILQTYCRKVSHSMGSPYTTAPAATSSHFSTNYLGCSSTSLEFLGFVALRTVKV